MHGLGFCCCDGSSCNYFTDQFTRTDTIGTDWTQLSGTWASSGELTTSNSYASIRCNTTHPTSGTSYRAYVVVCGGEEGDALRLWVNNGDPVAEVVFHTCSSWTGSGPWSSGQARYRLFKNSSLVGDLDAPGIDPGFWVGFNICASGNHVLFGGAGYDFLSVATSITTSTCGLGTGTLLGSTAAQFDDFILSKDAADDSSCPACGNSCKYFSDYFFGDPTNQTPVMTPAPWTFTGSWVWNGVYGGQGSIEANGDALALISCRNPSGTLQAALSMTPTGCSSGATLRLLSDYQNNDNYIFVEYQFNESIRFGRRLAGAETIYGSVVANPPPIWIVTVVGTTCVSAWLSQGFFGVGPTRFGTITHVATVDQFGLKNISGISGFSNVWLAKHSGTDSGCADWPCVAEPEPNTCARCNNTPAQWEVAISGVVSDSFCDANLVPLHCAKYNGVWVVDQSATNPCVWTYDFSAPSYCNMYSCDPCHLALTLSQEGSDVVLTVSSIGWDPLKSITFRKVFTGVSTIACLSLIEENIPLFGWNTCDGSSASCMVTAVS